MELDITAWVERFGDEPERFSDSIANSGLQDIGQVTWRNAVAAADELMFVTDENRDALVDHFAGYGACERAELAAYSDAELNALLFQLIAGDYQEYRYAEDCDELEEYMDTQGGRLYICRPVQTSEPMKAFYYIGT